MDFDELQLYRWVDDGGPVGPEMEIRIETKAVLTWSAIAGMDNGHDEINLVAHKIPAEREL
jgi:hypothetical protein